MGIGGGLSHVIGHKLISSQLILLIILHNLVYSLEPKSSASASSATPVPGHFLTVWTLPAPPEGRPYITVFGEGKVTAAKAHQQGTGLA